LRQAASAEASGSCVGFVTRRRIAAGFPAQLIQQAGLPLGRAIQTVTAGWNAGRARLGESPTDCVDVILERVMLTSSEEIAFVTIHRQRAEQLAIRVDLPTTNDRVGARLSLAPCNGLPAERHRATVRTGSSTQ
jgi:hypothetical protein